MAVTFEPFVTDSRDMHQWNLWLKINKMYINHDLRVTVSPTGHYAAKYSFFCLEHLYNLS